MDFYTVSDNYVYHSTKGDGESGGTILASLDVEDDFFLKITGPAADVVPLMGEAQEDGGISYDSIASTLLKSHPVLTEEIVHRNLPKMLDYLVDGRMALRRTAN